MLADLSNAWLIFAGIAACLVGLVLWIQQWWRSTKHHERGRRGRRGERHASTILKRAGYTIVEEQVHRQWQLQADGQLVNASCRADFLVSRNKCRYIAEVKTGKIATNPAFPATRRQLLEYAHVYQDVDGLLLVDVQNRRVLEVAFP